MKRISHFKRQAIEHIDRYFAGEESADDLCSWAGAQTIFANPKALDNSDDWSVSNALALMRALSDSPTGQPVAEERLREAWRFLSGEEPFPKDRWPVGLLR